MGRAHYTIESKVQWKPFWLATQLKYPQNDWLGGNYPYTMHMMYAHGPHFEPLQGGGTAISSSLDRDVPSCQPCFVWHVARERRHLFERARLQVVPIHERGACCQGSPHNACIPKYHVCCSLTTVAKENGVKDRVATGWVSRPSELNLSCLAGCCSSLQFELARLGQVQSSSDKWWKCEAGSRMCSSCWSLLLE